MKTIYTITKGTGDYAWESYKQDLEYYIFDELDGLILISHRNDRNNDTFCNNDGTGEDWLNTDWEYKLVQAKGYSQSEWEEFAVCANVKAMTEEQKGFYSTVLEELAKVYTHKNDYYVEAKQVNEDGWEKAYDVDCNSFDINWEEFPSDELIIQTFCEHEGIKPSEDTIINYTK